MCHQVSVYTSDDISEQLIWLPFTAHHHQVVHWISSRLVSCNDLHVSESHRRTWRKRVVLGPASTSGTFSFSFFFQSYIVFFFPHLTPLNTLTRYYNLQIVLLLLAFIAVPWMLFPKPFALRKIHMEVRLSQQLFYLQFILGTGLINRMKCIFSEVSRSHVRGSCFF